MIRLFVPDRISGKQEVVLSDKQVHYLLHVMRQKEGDVIAVFNGYDGEWQAVIQELNKKKGVVSTNQQTREQVKERPLILCPALIKKENMDLVFQKATELGVTEIYPLITARTVVPKLNKERAQSLLAEAAEQCERLSVPTLHEPQKLGDFLRDLNHEIRPVCLAERGTTRIANSDGIRAFCVGPEGGWTPEELALFEKAGADFLHFGQTILRAETASIVALAYVGWGF